MALVKCSECNGKVSNKAANCPHCGAPMEARSAAPKAKESLWHKHRKLSIGQAILVIIAVLFVIGHFTQDASSPSQSTEEQLASAAYSQCKSHVKSSLKAPSTADFPWTDYKAYLTQSGSHYVTSYVDAQNGFGAMIRSHWTCEIRHSGGDRHDSASWRLVNLSVD